MNNRLQFRHHNEVFDTRDAAIEYIKSQIRFTEEGLAAEDPSYGFSLLAEPTVLLYKKEEDETDPHLMLVIGSQTNPGVETGSGQYTDNRFCIIDIDKTEQEIADLAEELEKAIKSLTLIALSSDTLNFYADKTDDGTYVSGDVKVAETHIFDDSKKANNMMITPEGLFIYVNLEYDEDKEEFTFYVSNYDGTLSETTVKLPNNYVVSGYYSKRDESIHLIMKEGGEVVIDCEKLIAEWTVEGDASKTPVVLTREELDYDNTDEHHHIEPWQDVLRADVRIKDEEKILLPDGTYKYVKDENSTNILSRTNDARYLYVDGKASNIIYYKNGEKSTVKAALDELQNIKLSTDSDNIIINKTDGFFASTKLSYISKQNKLVFKASGQEDTVIQLNGFKLFENIYYDPTQEALVITYIDGNDKVQIVTIPIGEMIRDWEWEPQNEGHNIKIVKKRNVAGNDKVSADAKIYNDPDNILVDKNHELFVKGTADNIKYENGTVKDAIDGLKTTDAALDNKINIEIARAEVAEGELDGKIQAIEDEIGDGFGPRNTVRDEIDNLQSEIEAVSADSASSIKDIINIDESINVDKTEPTKPVISVNLSQEIEDEKPNIIKLNADGLYAGVDLLYQFNEEVGTNQLIFKTTNATKVYDLKTNSVIDKIYYDSSREAIIIEYTVNGHRMPDVVIPVGDLINEWRVEDGHPHAVELEKVRIASGTTEQDVLKASVIITDDHDDNILVMDDGALYVPGADIEQNKQDIADLKDRMDTAEDDIDNLENELALETERRISGDTILTNRITTEETRAREAETRIETALNNEIARAQLKEGELNTAITEETLRAQAADNELYQKIADESSERREADANLLSLINSEISRAQTQEGIIARDLQSEIERSTAKDEELDGAIEDLEDAIEAATLTFEDTHSIDFNNPRQENNVVKANVKIANAPDNIILVDEVKDGVYASVDLTYIPSTNTLKFKVNGEEKIYPIAAGSILDDAWYDPTTKNLVFKTKTADGEYVEVVVPAYDLFDAWEVDNKPEGCALELTLVTGRTDPTSHEPLPDQLWGRVLISPLEDNQLIIDTNGLYVPGSGATIAQCVSGKTDKIYELLYGEGEVMGGCGENTRYKPYAGACIISAATSFNEADKLLNDQICHILNMWVSGITCTNESTWVEYGENRKIQVDTRLSHGKYAEMVDENLYINNLNGDYIDPTGTEFTDTNALRIVCLEEGASGVTPDIRTKQNGIYLSNVWDCGLYYDASTLADQEAKGKAQAAGYNTNYSTDDNPSAMNYNYMNNVR